MKKILYVSMMIALSAINVCTTEGMRRPREEATIEEQSALYPKLQPISDGSYAYGLDYVAYEFQGMTLGTNGITSMCNFANSNPFITTLHFNSDNFGDNEARIAAASLRGNTHIQELYLSENFIGNLGAGSLADLVIPTCSNLQLLELSTNSIENEGASSIAKALPLNQHIRNVILMNNQIGDAGARALAEAIRNHPSMQTLEIADNPISDVGVAALADAYCDPSCKLDSLDCSLNLATLPVRQAIWERVQAAGKTGFYL